MLEVGQHFVRLAGTGHVFEKTTQGKLKGRVLQPKFSQSLLEFILPLKEGNCRIEARLIMFSGGDKKRESSKQDSSNLEARHVEVLLLLVVKRRWR
jgi:hypothetical protein